MLKLKLLIVDDEPGMRRGASRSLRNFQFQMKDFKDIINYEISECDTGLGTIELLKNNQYDLLLLDYKLEDITGLDILEVIKEKKYNIITIMMTAFASLEVAVSATKNGAYDFIAKPFTPDELRSVIRKASSSIVLKRKAKLLEEEKRQVRFQFLSVLSHELKAPLNAIEGYLQIMDKKIAGNDISNYEKMIHRSLDRIGGMRKLIFDLLDLTRIESGQKVREIKEINIIEAVKNSIETNSAIARNNNITIHLNAEDSILINGDMSELEIMFNNLISNAIKYNKLDGQINIDISRTDSTSILIKVADTGIGMTQDEKGRLFREFVRFKNDKTRNIEGSGLGLSILKKLISLYDGKINVESEFDIGTTFIITLNSLPSL